MTLSTSLIPILRPEYGYTPGTEYLVVPYLVLFYGDDKIRNLGENVMKDPRRLRQPPLQQDLPCSTFLHYSRTQFYQKLSRHLSRPSHGNPPTSAVGPISYWQLPDEPQLRSGLQVCALWHPSRMNRCPRLYCIRKPIKPSG